MKLEMYVKYTYALCIFQDNASFWNEIFVLSCKMELC